MKNILSLISLLVLVSACTSTNVAKERNEIVSLLSDVEEPTLIIGDNSAAVLITIMNRSMWEWNKIETPDNATEYRWAIGVENDGNTYDYGFGRWKYPGSQPESGSLEDLLNAGQIDLWKEKPEGGATRISREGIRITKSSSNTLIIIVEGKKYVDMLFSSEPSTAKLIQITPYEERSDTEINVIHKTALLNE